MEMEILKGNKCDLWYGVMYKRLFHGKIDSFRIKTNKPFGAVAFLLFGHEIKIPATIDYSQWRGLDLQTGKAIPLPEGTEDVELILNIEAEK